MPLKAANVKIVAMSGATASAVRVPLHIPVWVECAVIPRVIGYARVEHDRVPVQMLAEA